MQVGLAAEFPQDPAQIIYPSLVITATEPHYGSTHTTNPTFTHSEVKESYV